MCGTIEEKTNVLIAATGSFFFGLATFQYYRKLKHVLYESPVSAANKRGRPTITGETNTIYLNLTFYYDIIVIISRLWL